jgi:hypothetical protein
LSVHSLVFRDREILHLPVMYTPCTRVQGLSRYNKRSTRTPSGCCAAVGLAMSSKFVCARDEELFAPFRFSCSTYITYTTQRARYNTVITTATSLNFLELFQLLLTPTRPPKGYIQHRGQVGGRKRVRKNKNQLITCVRSDV